MVLNNAQLHPAVTFSNKVFIKDKEYSRYVCCFRNCAIYTSFTIQPSAFSRYDMDISCLIRNLGWQSLFEDQRFTYFPEAVRLFYVNLKRGSGPDLYSFKKTIGNFEIMVTADLLAIELGSHMTASGQVMMDNFVTMISITAMSWMILLTILVVIFQICTLLAVSLMNCAFFTSSSPSFSFLDPSRVRPCFIPPISGSFIMPIQDNASAMHHWYSATWSSMEMTTTMGGCLWHLLSLSCSENWALIFAIRSLSAMFMMI
ncbi:unnamed protein product [Linum trigynum]|uniref:Uncharacterized protein n=1 Tax=Linum trigynum TaxID=586398 RepID=A0AAV2E913_9ROSI